MAVNSQFLLPTRPPWGHGSCSRWLPLGMQGSGSTRRGAFARFIKPEEASSSGLPATPSPSLAGVLSAQPRQGALLLAAARRAVRGAVLASGHRKGLPLAADHEGILTRACSSLGWSKTSHPSETPEDNDGWSSTEEPVNSSDAEEEGRAGPGKLVTWALTWPVLPAAPLGARGPRAMGGSSCACPLLVHISLAHSAHLPALPCRGALLTLHVSTPAFKRIALSEVQTCLRDKVLLSHEPRGKHKPSESGHTAVTRCRWLLPWFIPAVCSTQSTPEKDGADTRRWGKAGASQGARRPFPRRPKSEWSRPGPQGSAGEPQWAGKPGGVPPALGVARGWEVLPRARAGLGGVSREDDVGPT